MRSNSHNNRTNLSPVNVKIFQKKQINTSNDKGNIEICDNRKCYHTFFANIVSFPTHHCHNLQRHINNITDSGLKMSHLVIKPQYLR